MLAYIGLETCHEYKIGVDAKSRWRPGADICMVWPVLSMAANRFRQLLPK